ncbi:protein of unknown function (plasmid) [Azospirillum baldaniorum]|uniref:Tetratricopeptide repeat protein n=1 Tax=Azospirillum baldaniorum TaxID=1064539 RepID=A0A9P1JUI6_9PROT|nr:protein of unknown function [Azospirillum baldaniorum]
MATLLDVLDAAVNHHMAGRLAEAAQDYRVVLAVEPAQPDALHLLGVAEAQRGVHAAAAALITRSLRLRPDTASPWANLGGALRALGAAERADAALTRALTLDPALADALTNVGSVTPRPGRLSRRADVAGACRTAAPRPSGHRAQPRRRAARRATLRGVRRLPGCPAGLPARPRRRASGARGQPAGPGRPARRMGGIRVAPAPPARPALGRGAAGRPAHPAARRAGIRRHHPVRPLRPAGDARRRPGDPGHASVAVPSAALVGSGDPGAGARPRPGAARSPLPADEPAARLRHRSDEHPGSTRLPRRRGGRGGALGPPDR